MTSSSPWQVDVEKCHYYWEVHLSSKKWGNLIVECIQGVTIWDLDLGKEESGLINHQSQLSKESNDRIIGQLTLPAAVIVFVAEVGTSNSPQLIGWVSS